MNREPSTTKAGFAPEPAFADSASAAARKALPSVPENWCDLCPARLADDAEPDPVSGWMVCETCIQEML